MSIIPSMVAERPVLIETIYVDDDGGADYTKIQNAINAANPGDTVFVYNGIYNETLKIDVSINLIGEDKEKTVIDGRGVGNIIEVTADDVSISGFTIQHSGPHMRHAGIYVCKTNYYEEDIIYNVTIFGNNINNNVSTGIYLLCVYNSNIYENNITGRAIGIQIERSSNNKIIGNIVKNGYYYGIYTQGWGNGRISDYFYGSMAENNIISGNTVSNYREGILIGGSSVRNKITGNNVIENRGNGILTAYCFKNEITKNNLIDNENNALCLAARLIHLNANTWDENYWGEPKDAPVPINGRYFMITLIPFGGMIEFPIVTYDKNPAQEPYDI